MKFKAALFYNGSIVFYSVFVLRDNHYKAKLDVDKEKSVKPPVLVELHKDHFGWKTECSDTEIVKELTAAIEHKRCQPKLLQ